LQGTAITFRRWLHLELWLEWDEIWRKATNFQLTDSQDDIFWTLGTKKRFTVKSVYDGLTKNENELYHKRIWKGKIPAKIKIFLWLMSCNALLTKDNLMRRNWQGDSSCMFCDYVETIPHLFFQCPIARVVWSIVAKCFGANNIPSNLNQCWSWCEQWFPFGKKYHP
jgi:hypothetical protein